MYYVSSSYMYDKYIILDSDPTYRVELLVEEGDKETNLPYIQTTL